MQTQAPHYLLFTDSVSRTSESREWRFVLEPTGMGERIVAADCEPEADNTRLALLAVVRGLEALDGPARVTLLVSNRFVRQGIRRDLAQWRERGWRWERFGEQVAIRDLDLWKRIDRALAIHQVECFAWSADGCEFEAAASSEVASEADFREHLNSGEPNILSVPRQSVERTYPQWRQGVAAARQLELWGHDMLDSLAGIGRTALSRTA